MKIIRDTASSSGAVFGLDLRLETDDGRNAAMHLSVSSGICYSADGEMEADTIYLCPQQEKDDVVVGNRSIYAAADLDELCDILFEAPTIEGWQNPYAEYRKNCAKVNGLTFAIDGRLKCYHNQRSLAERIEEMGGRVSGVISSETDYLICNNENSASRKNLKAKELGIPVISDLDFLCGAFGEAPPEECDDSGMTVSVRDVAPITIDHFKKACAEAGITPANLKKITIQNRKFGSRDSAMFIFSDNDQFLPYLKMYRKAPDSQKEAIAREFISFVKAGPVIAVCDNECQLPEMLPCVWIGGDEKLEEEMRACLEGNAPGHWMGTYVREFEIDVAARTVTSRAVLCYGDI